MNNFPYVSIEQMIYHQHFDILWDNDTREITQRWYNCKMNCKWATEYDRGMLFKDDNLSQKEQFQFFVLHPKSYTFAVEAVEWCIRNCTGRFYRTRLGDANSLSVMAFEKAKDAVLFKMIHLSE